nr:farnesyl diphosphate synthase [uncultured Gemmiger sp.]
MQNTEYQVRYQAYVSAVEQRLQELCDKYLPEQARIGQAARYSLLGGGKRVRAVLTLASCEVGGKDPALAVDYACALEMLHCYSLIHDDLPCMDNDDTRRGRPSCHCQYDEATALLAADALVTAAFEVIANAPLSAESRVHAAACLAAAGGARGMLYGQELDKKYEQERAGEEELLNLHRHKTGALIVAAAELGCIAADAAPGVRESLTRYAAGVGLVFQIVDDILDVTATTEELGKPVGSDEANDKTTFVTLYGLGGAQELAKQNNQDSLQALDPLGSGAWFLRELAQQLVQRRK